jgi:hypothetical protein
MKTDDEKLNEILVDALASALPGASVDDLDTTEPRKALTMQGEIIKCAVVVTLDHYSPEMYVPADTCTCMSVEEFAEISAGGFFVPIRRSPYSHEELYILAEQAKGIPIHTAIEAVANEIEDGTTDFDELRLLAAKHIFDAGGDSDDPDVVDAVIRAAEMTVHGTRVIDGFERLVA